MKAKYLCNKIWGQLLDYQSKQTLNKVVIKILKNKRPSHFFQIDFLSVFLEEKNGSALNKDYSKVFVTKKPVKI
jgi:hypothetical protein